MNTVILSDVKKKDYTFFRIKGDSQVYAMKGKFKPFYVIIGSGTMALEPIGEKQIYHLKPHQILKRVPNGVYTVID